MFFLFLCNMKSRIILFLLTFLLLITLSACRHRYPKVLVETDCLIGSNPQIALAKLDSIASNMDTTKTEDVMYLRLLKMMAKDKLYMPLGNLDSISTLVDFYKTNDDYPLLAKAYYLLGRKQSDMGNYPSALISFRKVVALLDENEDIKLRGLTNAQLGEIFGHEENLSLAISFFKESYRCDSIMKDKNGLLYDLRDIGLSYDYLGYMDSALFVYNRAIPLAKELKDKELEREIYLQISNCYIDNNSDSVVKYMSLVNSMSSTCDAEEIYVKAVYHQMKGDDSLAASLFHKILPISEGTFRLEILRRLICIDGNQLNVQEANKYVTEYFELSDSLKRIDADEQAAKGKALFDYAYQIEKVGELEIQNKNKQLELLALIASVVIIFFSFSFYWELSLVKKLKLQNKIKDWKLMALGKTSSKKGFMSTKWNYYLTKNKHLTDEEWGKLEMEVERSYPKFKDKLYSCNKLSSQQFHVCLLVKIKMPTSKIAILTSKAPSTISTTKQRLYEKITSNKGKAEDLDDFLELI